jgi:hypothetical protein
MLPDAVTRTSATRVRVKGGAHLSIAFALGAALPSSRVGTMEIVDQRAETWTSGTESSRPDTPHLRVVAQEEAGRKVTTGRPRVAAYVDFISPPSDAAFDRFLEERADELDAWIRLGTTSSNLIRPSDAGEIAAEAVSHVRDLSNRHNNAEVHLLLRCPFPLAVLLGRLTNTVRAVVYEWDDSDPATGEDLRARYVPSLHVRASATQGMIREVLLLDESSLTNLQ